MRETCEWCGQRMRPVLVEQKFCSRDCQGQFYGQERREAVELYRSMGLHPRTPAMEQQQQVAAE